MGFMNKMRENTGIILWILVIAFGVIWVLQDAGTFDTLNTSGGQDIIVVNGDPVTYKDYIAAVDAQMQQYQQRNGESMPPQMVDQTRESVYQSFVEDRLRKQEMDKLGITVSDDEVRDMVLGENPHPLIKTYFGDGNGNVNRALLQNFIDNPESSEQLIQIENYLRTTRRQEKMEKLLEASVHVSDQDILAEYNRSNLKVTADWVGLRYAAIPDDSIEVSDGDLRDYYDDHQKDFERKRTYTIDYVTRSKQPTSEDSTRVFQSVQRLHDSFAEADDDSLFLARNASERPYSSAWFKATDLDSPVATLIFSGTPQPGDVFGPVYSGDEVHLIKVDSLKPAEEVDVRASHILFRSAEDNAEIEQQAREVKRKIEQGASFAAMARQYSSDGTSQQGGDLGWFGKGKMVAPFEEAALSAPVGKVVGPVKTQFGYHLIMVTGRADQEVRIADYAERIRTDIGTLNRMQEKLEDLRYFAGENGDFSGEAERLGVPVEQVQFEAGQQFIPGIGNSRAIANFLETAAVGDISDVVELNDDFVVVHVDTIMPEGYRPFDEVKDEIEPRVKKEKKAVIQNERMKEALAANDFDGLADALGVVQHRASQVGYQNMVVPSMGREPKFVGTILGLKEGEVSGVIKGENSAIVARVSRVYEPAPITDADRDRIRKQLVQQRTGQLKSRWIAELRNQADIEDNRRLFQQ